MVDCYILGIPTMLTVWDERYVTYPLLWILLIPDIFRNI